MPHREPAEGRESACSPLLSRTPEAGHTAARRSNPADPKRTEARLAGPRRSQSCEVPAGAHSAGPREVRPPALGKNHALAARPPDRARWVFLASVIL